MKKTIILFVLVFAAVQSVWAVSAPVRIKDIAHILEARDNQLMGFGLVVGLRNTGDKQQTGFTQQALTNLLSRMGVVPQNVDFKSKNVAAVMVTATLPPFIKTGQKIDVTVSSVGDATSLQGGTLLTTPLKGVDDQVYAVGQGSILIGVDATTPSVPYVKQEQRNAGRIPGGALVEKEVPVSIAGKGNLTIVLNEPDFTTANRVANSITKLGLEGTAVDAVSITVPIEDQEALVQTIAQIENLSVVPDEVAKIIVNERTGTIVIGENVRISPCAVSYAGLDVTIGDVNMFSEGNQAQDGDTAQNYSRARATAVTKKKQAKLNVMKANATLADLARALNTIGASPADLIAILQAMKRSGAIKAEIEVI